jgi:chromosome segregation ATPase
MSQTQRPNPFDHRRGPEPPDPTERLAKLEDELKQFQARIDDLTRQQTALQTDASDLKTFVQEVRDTLTSYGAQIKDLENQLQTLQYFYNQKQKMVMAAIGDQKGPIDELIREFDYETERMTERLEELTDKFNEASDAATQANNEQTAKQNEYNKATGYQQTIVDRLAHLTKLSTSITQAGSSNDTASMYFEILEFQNVLDRTEIVSQHQLAVELKQKLGELDLAREQARAKTAEMTRLQTEQAAQQKAVADRRSGRQQQLLTEIQNKFPAPAQPTGTASSTGAAGSASGTSSSTTPPATSSGTATAASVQKK